MPKIGSRFYRLLDRFFVPRDLRLFHRSRNVAAIPPATIRYGGKVAYGEWCHVIGLFQALIYHHLERKTGNQILDVGCGMGLVGMAATPFTADGGHLTGIDVNAAAIDYCQDALGGTNASFSLLETANQMYSPGVAKEQAQWTIGDASMDLVTALSVWTHFQEADASFYLAEVKRVLKPGATAIISWFELDSVYEEAVRNDRVERWVFDTPCEGSAGWRYPSWVRVPENAIGVEVEALASVIAASGLERVATYPGAWKVDGGFYYQDVLVLRRPID
ncbi:MAG: class I SAM-dependent methyltransferase [Planctomycetota bacterium]